MINLDVPNKIKNILADIQNNLRGKGFAVLAGGALRDLVCGKTINDLDIFIRCEELNSHEIVSIFGAQPVRKNLEFIGYLEERGETSRISRSYITYSQGYEVNLVFMPKDFTVMSLIEDFDFGICQIAFDGNELYYTSEFEKDINNKTLTVINGNHTREVHTKKMKVKFPDHTLIEGI